MGLSSVGFTALRFTLALAVILLFSPSTFAQHSGGGGGSASAASSGGGGGSHGGSSGGGSASSGGSHSSGGSSSHSSGSASHSSTGHNSSSGAPSSHSSPSHPSTSHASTSHAGTSHSNTARTIHEPGKASQGKTETSHKHGFFSFLRHHVPNPLPNPPAPKPKPEPKEPIAELRRPFCFRGPCPVCPAGQVHGGSACAGTILRDRIRRVCPAGESWTNGACLQQTWYQDECGGLRMMMERQAQRMHAAQLDRQITCSLGPWQQCSDLTSSAESEAGFYQELQNRYQACQRRSPAGPHYRGFRVPGYSGQLSFEPLRMQFSRP